MLLNAQGKRFRRTMAAPLVIYVAESEHGPWSPLKPADVPEWLKNQDTLGELVQGFMCCDPKKDGRWYRAEKLVAH